MHASTLFVERGSVRLATESFGEPTSPAVLLIMSAIASMLWWPEPLCAALPHAIWRATNMTARSISLAQ